MTQRHAQLRSRGASDVDGAIAYLRGDAGDAVALDFIDALDRGDQPHHTLTECRSLRFAYELGDPELRAWGLRRFPSVIFYVPFGDGIDIWRVLHIRRDIPGVFYRDD